jgi:hypothetical protein
MCVLALSLLREEPLNSSEYWCIFVGRVLQYGVPTTRGTWHLFGPVLCPSLVLQTEALELGGHLWIFCEPAIMHL